MLLLQACSTTLNRRVLDHVRDRVGPEIRMSDGYVFQHLLDGPIPVSELGRRLGVTQQAASKQVADLEDRGLVNRRPDPHDGRGRLVSLTRRGRRAVQAGREARGLVVTELRDELGDHAVDTLLRTLRRVSDHTGAMDNLLRRGAHPSDG